MQFNNPVLSERYKHICNHDIQSHMGSLINNLYVVVNGKRNPAVQISETNEGILISKQLWKRLKDNAQSLMHFYFSSLKPLLSLLGKAISNDSPDLSLEELSTQKIVTILQEVYPTLKVKISEDVKDLKFTTDINRLKRAFEFIVEQCTNNSKVKDRLVQSVTLGSGLLRDNSRLTALQIIVNGNRLPINFAPTLRQSQDFSSLVSLGVGINYLNPGDNFDCNIISLTIPNLDSSFMD